MTAAYYTILPAEIRLDKRLSAFEKILYSDILALANKKGYCYATNQYFAKTYQMSISSISHAISKLVEFDFIKRIYEYKDNTKMIERRKLYVQINHNTFIKNLPYSLAENTKQGIGENCEDNNINMNNIKNNIDHTTKVSMENSSRPPKKYDYLQAMLDRI
ncbi:helix-turn-helix domain-containing protein [Anaerococcus degeneri]|uniref:Helix-turn-helix domain-containing protein n=1 Tax=Anaerococcus degeneri TaxID=361500 RepID=A0ABS7Z2B5_9FIRM|nr:helix-turn-helix domain-containing protein [Anaerococcus degeneri]MBP2014700.1 hypothetical protein [Anaerococcus degeneri]MCA2096911.1 helix-turn-helix domain-containing protein [Anaerococcus degeneri]